MSSTAQNAIWSFLVSLRGETLAKVTVPIHLL
jgi:hypothetical protein